jgi:hypothetical protein
VNDALKAIDRTDLLYIKGLGVGDEVAGWWAAVVAVASYWLLCEEDKAEQLHARVEA